MPCLAASQVRPVELPIDIFEPQGCHFTSTQAIGHQEQPDGVISLARRAAPVYCIERALGLLLGNRTKQFGKAISRQVDRG